MLDVACIEGKTWVDYAEDEQYEITFISDAQERLIQKRLAAGLKKDDTPANQVLAKLLEMMDVSAKVELLVEHVTAWKGLRSNGKPLECNEDNKRLVFENFANRRDWLYGKCKDNTAFGIGDESSKN